jgi:hypothetical protein
VERTRIAAAERQNAEVRLTLCKPEGLDHQKEGSFAKPRAYDLSEPKDPPFVRIRVQKQLKGILGRANFEDLAALQSHRKVLQKNLTRMRTLIETIDKTIKHLKGAKK